MAELRALTRTGTSVVLDDKEIERFGSGLRGEALRAGDEGYDAARRVWNGVIDKHPAVIARCAGTSDVIRAVNFARENDLLVAVRGGGHNVAGTASCDGGLVIDLSTMRGVRVDPGGRTARAEGGATWADLDRETQVFGLATPGGVVSRTGIGGLTLGGGVGWLRRKHGLSCDNLVSAEVVTADGGFLTASEEENADLFWGLRGGGGGLGVVTSFEYRLHPVGPEVTLCFVLYPGARAGEILRSLDAYASQAPDEVSPGAALGRVPSGGPFPEEWHGEPFAAVVAVYVGDADEGESVLKPLRELGDPIADLSGRVPYTGVQSLLDANYPDGGRYYWKSQNLGGMGDEEIESLTTHAYAAPSGRSTIGVLYQGGAIDRVGAGETAFGGRGAAYLVGVESNWEEPGDDGANIAWARECVDDLGRFSPGGQYFNFPGFFEEGERMIREAYGENYGRMAALNDKYDPDGLFRVRQNGEATAG